MRQFFGMSQNGNLQEAAGGAQVVQTEISQVIDNMISQIPPVIDDYK